MIKPFVVEWSFRSLLTELRRLFNHDPIYCEVFLELQIQLDSTLNDQKRCFNVFPVLASQSHKLINRRDLARKSVIYKFNIQVPFKAFQSYCIHLYAIPTFGALNKDGPDEFWSADLKTFSTKDMWLRSWCRLLFFVFWKSLTHMLNVDNYSIHGASG